MLRTTGMPESPERGNGPERGVSTRRHGRLAARSLLQARMELATNTGSRQSITDSARPRDGRRVAPARTRARPREGSPGRPSRRRSRARPFPPLGPMPGARADGRPAMRSGCTAGIAPRRSSGPSRRCAHDSPRFRVRAQVCTSPRKVVRINAHVAAMGLARRTGLRGAKSPPTHRGDEAVVHDNWFRYRASHRWRRRSGRARPRAGAASRSRARRGARHGRSPFMRRSPREVSSIGEVEAPAGSSARIASRPLRNARQRADRVHLVGTS